MKELDFKTLFRNTIGFDYLPDYTYHTNNFPPYNVIRVKENQYEVQVALAGYGPEDVEIIQEDRKLKIASTNTAKEQTETDNYLHRGIAKRNFSFTLLLEDHVEVIGAQFINGLLIVNLERQLPERLQPRKIEISSSSHSLEYNQG